MALHLFPVLKVRSAQGGDAGVGERCWSMVVVVGAKGAHHHGALAIAVAELCGALFAAFCGAGTGAGCEAFLPTPAAQQMGESGPCARHVKCWECGWAATVAGGV